MNKPSTIKPPVLDSVPANEEEEIAPSIHTSGCNLEQEESEINEKFQETENNSPLSEEERKNE